jgi:hypothetical protein
MSPTPTLNIYLFEGPRYLKKVNTKKAKLFNGTLEKDLENAGADVKEK